jgi:hypothetical protein
VAAFDRSSLFESMSHFSRAQCESIAVELGMPRDRWPPASATPQDRARLILSFADRQPGGIGGLARAITDVVGSHATAPSSAWQRVSAFTLGLVRGARDRGFRRRFARYVEESGRDARTPGLRRTDEQRLRLEAVYIDRQLVSILPVAGAGGGVAEAVALLDGARPIDEHLLAVPPGRALCIVGESGAGKSTLLRRLALRAALGLRLRVPHGELNPLRHGVDQPLRHGVPNSVH